MSEQEINPCIVFDTDKETGKAFNIRVLDTDTGKELVVMCDVEDCTQEFIKCLASGRIFMHPNPIFQFKEGQQHE